MPGRLFLLGARRRTGLVGIARIRNLREVYGGRYGPFRLTDANGLTPQSVAGC